MNLVHRKTDRGQLQRAGGEGGAHHHAWLPAQEHEERAGQRYKQWKKQDHASASQPPQLGNVQVVEGVADTKDKQSHQEDSHQQVEQNSDLYDLSLIHISEPTRLGMISYAVFCL